MRSSLNRIKEVVDKVRHIQEEAESKGDAGAKYITDRCGRIAKDENKRLNVDVDPKTGKLRSKPYCSHRYYSQLMDNYRSGIKALGYKHHAIERHVSAFINKYSGECEELEKMLDTSLPIEKLRENMIKLRASAVTGSDFRKDLMKLKIEHHAYYQFETKGAIKDWISDDNKQQLKKKLKNQIRVNPDWVKEKARDLLTRSNPSVSDLAIGIAMSTGRRLTEVMKTAKFKKVDNKTLLFSGQLKTKNRHLFEELAPYEIPALIDADIILKALQRLRKDTGKDTLSYLNVLGETVESTVKDGDTKDVYHNRAVHKRYESTLNRAIRSQFENGHFSFKDCRAFYTEVTYEDNAKSGESRSAYRHRVLGHSQIETQLHYEAFKLDKSVPSLKVVELSDDESNGQQKENIREALVEYLEKADEAVQGYARAPKIAVMHEWLKAEVANGLDLENITPSYIRRHCLFDGKQLNLNTIKKYVDEFIQLDKFESPAVKPEPKNDLERELFELTERLEEIQERTEDIDREKEGLEEELEELQQRIKEIPEETEELESEQELLSDEAEELQDRIDELQGELENQQAEE
ncbi:TPA: hypothetical protein NJZ29_004608 [Vibrio parahaemolyticus]|uniref:protelomerase family protein n=1 Tax=Vibrio TaxID=662 RepID=UPI0005F1AB6D|nr:MULTISPECIES: protelomerase family protein [Vibrio]HCE1567606.1 hypothetical protein [Vibrio parahaemolyticus]HCG5354309.1 hypothetical protein [Vibrio parahaemolyticus]HCG5421980.1 hypothetical protein [Vibrio parahaemolyticus]HCG5437683.1 hypothetical protein [Vibrio parahaemolyticus]